MSKRCDQSTPGFLEQFNETDVDFIIGVEIDEPTFVNHTILGPKSQSFCQWTFMCKPRLPVMMRLINHVLHWLNEISQRQDKPISEIELNFDEVITGTGPSAFTNVVLAEMMVQTGHRMSWDTFKNISEPVIIGNTMVLTVEAFAAGQGHSHSGNHDNPLALVRHHYHASLWPSRHPRYSHPGYGQVEECNWDRECVDWWTEHTANWDNLTEEEQELAIAKHEEKSRERFDEEEAERIQHEKEDQEREDEELRNACKAASYVPAFLIDPDKIAEYVAAFQTPAPDAPPPADAPPADDHNDSPPADAPEDAPGDAPPQDAPKDAPGDRGPPKDAPPAEAKRNERHKRRSTRTSHTTSSKHGLSRKEISGFNSSTSSRHVLSRKETGGFNSSARSTRSSPPGRHCARRCSRTRTRTARDHGRCTVGETSCID